MYCLTEHLDYFNESVAGKHQLLKVDFDEIFKAPLAPEPVKFSSSSPPPSPKSVMSMPAPLTPNPLRLGREQAVASPTTVTSTAVFSEQCKEIPLSTPVKSRKRKIADPAAPVGAPLTEDAKRERNRQHAKRSRQRKREYMSSLEQSMQELKAENEKLFQLLGLTPEDKSVVVEREAAMSNAAAESFIEALKQPKNRVLSDDALASLRELF